MGLFERAAGIVGGLGAPITWLDLLDQLAFRPVGHRHGGAVGADLRGFVVRGPGYGSAIAGGLVAIAVVGIGGVDQP